MSKKAAKDLEKLATDMAVNQGLQVVGLLLITQNKPMTIQVQVRQKDGTDVSIDDCALFSKPLEEAIKESNLFKEPYLLEVSSPGLSEFLKTDREFKTFQGFPIEVTFENKEEKQLNESGLLNTRTKDHLIINIKGKMRKIPRASVISVRLESPTG